MNFEITKIYFKFCVFTFDFVSDKQMFEEKNYLIFTFKIEAKSQNSNGCCHNQAWQTNLFSFKDVIFKIITVEKLSCNFILF